jgi:hypothetical protein
MTKIFSEDLRTVSKINEKKQRLNLLRFSWFVLNMEEEVPP